jgi:hypothetical protein
MTVISSTNPAESLNGRADARLPSTIRRWPGRNSREILPRLFLNWVIAGAAFAIRQLPGMATFSPMILSMVIGIAFHTIVGTAAKLSEKGFRPALLGALALLFIAGCTLPLIKLME